MSVEQKGQGAGKDGAQVKDTPQNETATPATDIEQADSEPTQEELRQKVASGELKILSKDQVLDADDLIEEIVPVPEWGGAVKVRSFTKGKTIEIDERATVEDEIDPRRVQMFAFLEGVVEPQFGLEDQERLKEKSAACFDRVVTRIFTLSAQGRKAQESAESRFRD